jgi:hypothetical protein
MRGLLQGPFTLLLEKTDTVAAIFEQLKGKVSLRGDPNKKLKTEAPAPAPAPAAVVPKAAADEHAMALSEEEPSPPPAQQPQAPTPAAVPAAPPAAPMEDDTAIEEEVWRRAVRGAWAWAVVD